MKIHFGRTDSKNSIKKNILPVEEDTKENIKDSIELLDESFDTMIGIVVVVCVGGFLGSGAAVEGPRGASPCGGGALDQALGRLMNGEDVEVSEGVRLIKVNESMESEGGRSVKDSVWGSVKRFLSNYELQVKLSDAFEKKGDMVEAFRGAIGFLNEFRNEDAPRGASNGGFGGGKKGGGAILMMATMMGGMMAALGFGALGMLVMKALTVSSMALLLSAVIGLRRLLRRPDDDAGFGRISYIPVHTEHRRRRSFLDIPYRAHAKSK